MSSILVVYATKTGCTEGVAQRIAARLAEKGAATELVAAGDAPSPAGFEAVIIGSGIRAGRWHQSARMWLADNADELRGRPLALFTVNLTMAQEPERADEVRSWTDPLIEETGVTPIDVGLFAGWNEPKQFPLLERTILKAMKAPQGDFRDWSAIDAWTDQIAPKMEV